MRAATAAVSREDARPAPQRCVARGLHRDSRCLREREPERARRQFPARQVRRPKGNRRAPLPPSRPTLRPCRAYVQRPAPRAESSNCSSNATPPAPCVSVENRTAAIPPAVGSRVRLATNVASCWTPGALPLTVLGLDAWRTIDVADAPSSTALPSRATRSAAQNPDCRISCRRPSLRADDSRAAREICCPSIRRSKRATRVRACTSAARAERNPPASIAVHDAMTASTSTPLAAGATNRRESSKVRARSQHVATGSRKKSKALTKESPTCERRGQRPVRCGSTCNVARIRAVKQ